MIDVDLVKIVEASKNGRIVVLNNKHSCKFIDKNMARIDFDDSSKMMSLNFLVEIFDENKKSNGILTFSYNDDLNSSRSNWFLFKKNDSNELISMETIVNFESK